MSQTVCWQHTTQVHVAAGKNLMAAPTQMTCEYLINPHTLTLLHGPNSQLRRSKQQLAQAATPSLHAHRLKHD